MPQKQTQFDTGRVLTQQARKAPVQGVIQALDQFQQQEARLQRAQNMTRLQEKAMVDASKALKAGEALPQKEDKLLRRDLTEAYNNASRQVYKVQDAQRIQEIIMREESAYKNGDLKELNVHTSTDFDEYMREKLSWVYKKAENPVYGTEYASDLIGVLEPTLADAKNRLAMTDVERQVNEDKNRVVKSLEDSEALSKDIVLQQFQELTKDGVLSKEDIDTLVASAKAFHGSLTAAAEQAQQSWGQDATFTRLTRDPDALIEDTFAVAINDMVDRQDYKGANKLIRSLWDGRHFKDNKILQTLRDRTLQGMSGVRKLYDQRKDLMRDATRTQEGVPLVPGGRSKGKTWVSVSTTSEEIRQIGGTFGTAQRIASSAIKGSLDESLQTLIDIMHMEVAEKKFLGVPLQVVIAQSGFKDEESIAAITDMYNHPAGVPLGAGDHAANHKAIEKYKRSITTSVAFDPAKGYHNAGGMAGHVETDARGNALGNAPYDTAVFTSDFREAGGVPEIAGAKGARRISAYLNKTYSEGLAMVAKQGARPNPNADRSIPDEARGGMANELVSLIQAYDNNPNSQVAFDRMYSAVIAVEEGIKGYNPGLSVNSFKFLGAKHKEFSKFSSIFDAIPDLRNTDPALVRSMVDVALEGKTGDNKVLDRAKLPSNATAFWSHEDAKTANKKMQAFSSANNFGIPNTAISDLVYNVVRKEMMEDAATNNPKAMSSYARKATEMMEQLQAGGNYIGVSTKDGKEYQFAVPTDLNPVQKSEIEGWMQNVNDPSFLGLFLEKNQAGAITSGNARMAVNFDGKGNMEVFLVQRGRAERLRLRADVPTGAIASSGLSGKHFVNKKAGGPIVINKFAGVQDEAERFRVTK